MEKLLKLLNEYKKSRPFLFTSYDKEYGIFNVRFNIGDNASIPEETIICKKFGFIQRLVENEKIRGFYDNALFEELCGGELEGYEGRLMYLSIQDDPIKFLVSILK